jgi:hypothetical protein
MQKIISYEPFCVDGCLIVPQEEKKITSVYNILGGAPVLNAHLEICALPKQVSFRRKFDRQIFDILNKSGLYRSEKSVRNSFFTPFENGKLNSKFDSSVLLRLSTAHFVQYLLNSKKGEIFGIYFQDFSYNLLEYTTFQLDNARMLGGIKEFEKEIQEYTKWQKNMIEIQQKFAHIK